MEKGMVVGPKCVHACMTKRNEVNLSLIEN